MDGRFGNRTLNALRVAVGEKRTEVPQGKPPTETTKELTKTKSDEIALTESAEAAEKALLAKEAAAKARVE